MEGFAARQEDEAPETSGALAGLPDSLEGPPLSHPARPYRVVVADDDEGFRTALREALEGDGRFLVVAEAATGVGIADLAAEQRADLVVLDVRMPSGGPEAATAIARRRATADAPRICALSAQTSAATVASMVDAGATGFLAKGSVGAHLADLLARCCAGEVVLAVPTAAEALRQAMGTPRVPSPS